jgi:hypothetical protein
MFTYVLFPVHVSVSVPSRLTPLLFLLCLILSAASALNIASGVVCYIGGKFAITTAEVHHPCIYLPRIGNIPIVVVYVAGVLHMYRQLGDVFGTRISTAIPPLPSQPPHGAPRRYISSVEASSICLCSSKCDEPLSVGSFRWIVFVVNPSFSRSYRCHPTHRVLFW